MKHFVAFLSLMFVSFSPIKADVFTVQPVVDIPLTGQSWDLTRYEPTAAEFDITREYRDSLISVWTPDCRFDFVEKADTLLQVAEETRKYRASFTPGILSHTYQPATESIKIKGRVYQQELLHGTGISNTSLPVAGRAYTISNADPINALLTHTSATMRWTLNKDSITDMKTVADSLICETTVDRYFISTDLAAFPLAFKRVTTTRFLGEVIETDSTAWITTYMPQDSSPRDRRKIIPATVNNSTDGINGLTSTSNGIISARVQGDELVIELGITHDNSDNVNRVDASKVVITDIIGRHFIDSALDNSGLSRLDISSLSRGEYLVQILSKDGDLIDAVKIIK